MPELPEAEANRGRVEEGALNRTIEAVTLGNDTKHIEVPSREERAAFDGRRFTEARRHGKLILAGSKSGPWIAVHLGMSGSLRVWDEGDEAPDYLRITFAFEGGRRLAFRCPRKLGWVRAVDDPDAFIEAEGYGPDALKIGADAFAERVAGGRGAIKAALMDQKKVAGVGNLWSDEILYQTGIAPATKASDLSDERIAAMHKTMRHALEKGVAVGADYGRLPDDWLITYRKAGTTCRRCDGKISRTKVGGRTAFYCDKHQS